VHGLYYEQRASAGLIITEGSQVSAEAVGYINTPVSILIHKSRLEKLQKRVHDKGVKFTSNYGM
jgi:N-ethylmaleimide reductase